jgi:hypothetical protein
MAQNGKIRLQSGIIEKEVKERKKRCEEWNEERKGRI